MAIASFFEKKKYNKNRGNIAPSDPHAQSGVLLALSMPAANKRGVITFNY